MPEFEVAARSELHLASELHDMLVAEANPNTKGVCQNCPLPIGHSSRGKILSPLPFSASLRLRCVRLLSLCKVTIIATPTKGAKQ